MENSIFPLYLLILIQSNRKPTKVYTDFTVETGGLTYIQKLFMSNLINALETQITKRVEMAHIPVRSRL